MKHSQSIAGRANSAQPVCGWSKWRFALSALSAFFALSVDSAPAHAQFFAFGQNKIQYRKLNWRIIRGPHVDLYFYPAEAELAPAALAYAEASYDTLAVQFGHDVAGRLSFF